MPSTDNNFDILLSCIFDRGHLVVQWSDERRKTSPEIEKLIEDAWDQRLRDAQRRGKLLYPGRLCRLIDYGISESSLHLKLGPTDFRELVGTNLSHPELLQTHGPEYLSNALAVHASIVSSDRKIVIYERSNLVAEYPGFYDVCGGHIEPDFDFIDNKPDPFNAIIREINEEMSIAADEIRSIVCLGIIRNTKTFKLDLVFAVHTHRASNEVQKMPLGEEHVQIEFIDENPKSIRRFLQERQGKIAPAGEACIRLLLNMKNCHCER